MWWIALSGITIFLMHKSTTIQSQMNTQILHNTPNSPSISILILNLAVYCFPQLDCLIVWHRYRSTCQHANRPWGIEWIDELFFLVYQIKWSIINNKWSYPFLGLLKHSKIKKTEYLCIACQRRDFFLPWKSGGTFSSR